MAYVKRYVGGFLDGQAGGTPVDSAFLNAVEAALLKLLDTDPTIAGQVQVWNGAKFAPKLLTNAEIAAGAAIAKTKLAALGITDADVSGGAAIAKSKLNLAGSLVQPTDFAAGSKITTGTLAAGPPAAPSDKDIWIATAVDTSGTRWSFQYNSGSASIFKWEFIGGPPAIVEYTAGFVLSNGSAWVQYPTPMNWTAARAGDYAFDAFEWAVAPAGGNTLTQIGIQDETVAAFITTIAATYMATANQHFAAYGRYRQGTVSAGHTYGMRYWSNGASSHGRATFSITPIRII